MHPDIRELKLILIRSVPLLLPFVEPALSKIPQAASSLPVRTLLLRPGIPVQQGLFPAAPREPRSAVLRLSGAATPRPHTKQSAPLRSHKGPGLRSGEEVKEPTRGKLPRGDDWGLCAAPAGPPTPGRRALIGVVPPGLQVLSCGDPGTCSHASRPGPASHRKRRGGRCPQAGS